MYDRKKIRSAQNVTDVSFFVVCSDSIYLFITLLCYIASIFHVLTRFRAAMYYVADFSDEE